MGTSTNTLTQMIQDAVLKLCTQNVTFNKALEIDGIICISPGEETKEIVVKMHRTIVKPANAQTSNSETPPWTSSIASVESFSQENQNPRVPYHDSFEQHGQPPPARATGQHATPKQSRKPRQMTPTSVKRPAAVSATVSTPSASSTGDVGIKEEPSASPKAIKRPSSDNQHDTPEKQSKNEYAVEGYDLDNVKEEQNDPVTIELGDDEDEEAAGGYDEEYATPGASWMGDNSMGDNTMGDNSMEGGEEGANEGTGRTECVPVGFNLHNNHTEQYITATSPKQMPEKIIGVNPTSFLPESGTDMYQCDMCLKLFSNSANLSRHKKQHNSNLSLPTCELCGKRLARIDSLKRHYKSVHDVIGSKLKC